MIIKGKTKFYAWNLAILKPAIAIELSIVTEMQTIM